MEKFVIKQSQKQGPVRRYFHNIYQSLLTVAEGMGVTLKVSLKKPITLQYPEQLPIVPPAFRGLHVYEQDKCIACEMCVKICPIVCISMVYQGKGKTAHIDSYKVDYAKCLFCNLCIEVCPTRCIHLGAEYSLASYDRAGCAREFAKDIYTKVEPQSTTP